MRIDITPDKSLMQKLGMVGYRTEQAIAELLDNSIEARITDAVENVAVRLSPQDRTIRVMDDGRGMDGRGLADAMTIAKDVVGSGGRRLGQFGIGMKSACSALGRRFAVETSPAGSAVEYRVEYDEDAWLSDGSRDWGNFEMSEKRLDGADDWHGTRITIEGLKVPIYPNMVSKFKGIFGMRYAPYLQSGQISMRINSVLCRPVRQDVDEGSMHRIRLVLSGNNEIHGHVALLKRRSIRGNYGINLFRQGRMIRAHEKFGFAAHPENARIIGDLNLDHVPVNINKSAFIDGTVYREALKAFKTSPELRAVTRLSRSRREVSASAGSIFGYFGGRSPPQRLDGSVRSGAAAEILGRTEPVDVDMDGTRVRMRMESAGDGQLYTVDEDGTGITVSINRDSGTFRFVRNPLFLIGMIASEVRLLAKQPSLRGALSERNRSIETFIRDWSAGPGQKEGGMSARGRSRDRIPRLPDIAGYGLADELFDPHEHLQERFDARFQFTALSTLRPYLHNMLGRVVYTVYTVPSRGEDLRDLLAEDFGDRFAVLASPDPGTLRAVLDMPATRTVVAIREYAAIMGPTVAPPEKAYVDLVGEAAAGRVLLDEKDLQRVFSSMKRRELIDPSALRIRATSARKMRILERILGDEVG